MRTTCLPKQRKRNDIHDKTRKKTDDNGKHTIMASD